MDLGYSHSPTDGMSSNIIYKPHWFNLAIPNEHEVADVFECKAVQYLRHDKVFWELRLVLRAVYSNNKAKAYTACRQLRTHLPEWEVFWSKLGWSLDDKYRPSMRAVLDADNRSKYADKSLEWKSEIRTEYTIESAGVLSMCFFASSSAHKEVVRNRYVSFINAWLGVACPDNMLDLIDIGKFVKIVYTFVQRLSMVIGANIPD